jgi:hypothetical protein
MIPDAAAATFEFDPALLKLDRFEMSGLRLRAVPPWYIAHFQRGAMRVAPHGHLLDLFLVPVPQSPETAVPAENLRVPRVPALLVDDDAPYGVELPMLCEKMVPA